MSKFASAFMILFVILAVGFFSVFVTDHEADHNRVIQLTAYIAVTTQFDREIAHTSDEVFAQMAATTDLDWSRSLVTRITSEEKLGSDLSKVSTEDLAATVVKMNGFLDKFLSDRGKVYSPTPR